MHPAAQLTLNLQSLTNCYIVNSKVLYAFPVADPTPLGPDTVDGELVDHAVRRYGTPPPGFSLGFTILTRDNPADFCLTADTISAHSNPPPSEPSYVQRTLTLVSGFFQACLCGSGLFPGTPQSDHSYNLSPRVNGETIGRDFVKVQLVSEFERIVPPDLQNHLIVVIPPASTTFPMMYPEVQVSTHRRWRTGVRTWGYISTLLLADVPVITIPHLPSNLVGFRSAKPGAILFFKKIAYYLVKDIGELPRAHESLELMVAMEAHTIERRLIIIIMPREYAVAPVAIPERIWELEGE